MSMDVADDIFLSSQLASLIYRLKILRCSSIGFTPVQSDIGLFHTNNQSDIGFYAQIYSYLGVMWPGLSIEVIILNSLSRVADFFCQKRRRISYKCTADSKRAGGYFFMRAKHIIGNCKKSSIMCFASIQKITTQTFRFRSKIIGNFMSHCD